MTAWVWKVSEEKYIKTREKKKIYVNVIFNKKDIGKILSKHKNL